MKSSSSRLMISKRILCVRDYTADRPLNLQLPRERANLIHGSVDDEGECMEDFFRASVMMSLKSSHKKPRSVCLCCLTSLLCPTLFMVYGFMFIIILSPAVHLPFCSIRVPCYGY